MPRVMEIVTPLGEDLLFHGMHAREELGRLSDFENAAHLLEAFDLLATVPLRLGISTAAERRMQIVVQHIACERRLAGA